MDLLFEFLPLVLFFAIYYFTKDIFIATAVTIFATWIQFGYDYLRYKRIKKSILINVILLTVLGGFTIGFHNKAFIMIKPTVLYWVFAIVLLITDRFNKNFFRIFLAEKLPQIPHALYRKINFYWALFFAVMGIANLVIALNCDEMLWVKFKVFGTIIAMLLFAIIQIVWLKKYLRHDLHN